MPDDMSNKCQMCEITFNFFRRKHHCRKCGGLFCYLCSNIFKEIYLNNKAMKIRLCKCCVKDLKFQEELVKLENN